MRTYITTLNQGNQITYTTACYYAKLAHKLSVNDLLLRLRPFVNSCNYAGESLFYLTPR